MTLYIVIALGILYLGVIGYSFYRGTPKP